MVPILTTVNCSGVHEIFPIVRWIYEFIVFFSLFLIKFSLDSFMKKKKRQSEYKNYLEMGFILIWVRYECDPFIISFVSYSYFFISTVSFHSTSIKPDYLWINDGFI